MSKKILARFIGDVHGDSTLYMQLLHAENTIQVGDLGFDYTFLHRYRIDPSRHRVIAGNHDDYTVMDDKFVNQTDHFLGDFGVYEVPGFGKIFFVRGGNSIDKKYRREGLDWFPHEQIDYGELCRAIKVYEEVKPDFVVSHECPVSIISHVSDNKVWDGEEIRPSMTAHALQNMLEIHRPKTWIFGHHHKRLRKVIEGTEFICLEILGHIDYFSPLDLEN